MSIWIYRLDIRWYNNNIIINRWDYNRMRRDRDRRDRRYKYIKIDYR